ncbi:MAG: hypothetical protein WC869_03795 [Phycisphaerae bacterium]|jgi:hypothetical protein
MSAQDTDVNNETLSAPAPVSALPTSRLRRLKQGNLLLVLLFGSGLACVYLMSLRNGPATASAQQQDNDAQVTTVLTELKAGAAKRAQPTPKALAVVDTFYYQTRQRQIPPEQLAGNPFEFKQRKSDQPAPVAAAQTENEETAAGELRQSDALAAVKQLRLQSVLTGPRGNTAMISNNLLSEGQVIQGWSVAKIMPREVTLTWKDQTFQLKMP